MNVAFAFTLSACSGAPVDEAGADDVSAAPGMASDGALGGEENDREEATPEEIARYSADPDYERVPGFLMHRSCVFEVPEGAFVRALPDNSMRIRRTPEDAEEELPRCQHRSFRTKDQGLPSAQGAAPVPAAINQSWIEYSEAAPSNSTSLRPWFSRITGSWGVPYEPPCLFSCPLVLFFFDSLQNATDIIQPVLQWYPISGVQPPQNWKIAAWYVLGHGATAVHSTPKDVQPGQQVRGITKAANCSSSGVCTWTIHIQQGTTATSLIVALPRPFYRANQGVFEVYYLDSCATLPSTPRITFYDNTLFQPSASNVNNYVQVDGMVSWNARVVSGLALNCGFRAVQDPVANGTQLFWHN